MLSCHRGPSGSQQALTESSSSHLTKHKVTRAAPKPQAPEHVPSRKLSPGADHPDVRLTSLVACLVRCQGCWPPHLGLSGPWGRALLTAALLGEAAPTLPPGSDAHRLLSLLHPLLPLSLSSWPSSLSKVTLLMFTRRTIYRKLKM